MSHSSITVAASAEAVFDVLDDACAYPRWVVGAHRVRAVDPEWPAVGARFHHALGAPGAELKDSTRVLERDRPRLLRLEVRFRPVGIATVEITVRPEGDGTCITLTEEPTAGPTARVPRSVIEPLLAVRNAWALRRLRVEVQRRATLRESQPSSG